MSLSLVEKSKVSKFINLKFDILLLDLIGSEEEIH